MSRCLSCNVKLTPFELTRKIKYEDNKVEYIDMCNKCYFESGLEELVVVVERYDLIHETDLKPEETDELYSNEEGKMSEMCEEWERQ